MRLIDAAPNRLNRMLLVAAPCHRSTQGRSGRRDQFFRIYSSWSSGLPSGPT